MLSRSTVSKICTVCTQQARLSTSSAKTFALKYVYVANMMEKRIPIRPAHLEFTKSFVDRKILIAGGALVPEVEEGLLIFKGTRDQVEDFAKNDPYVKEGLIVKYSVHEWAVAVGGF